MNKRLSAVVVGATALAASAGLALVGGVAAHAATVPPWQNSTNSPDAVGTVTFYDAAGNVKTSGSVSDSPIAAYAIASGPIAVTGSGSQTAGLFAFKPDSGVAIADNWNGDQVSGFTVWPVTTGPANIQALSVNPTVTGASGDLDVSDFIAEGSSAGDSNAAYQNVYEYRLRSAKGSSQSPTYAVADIKVTGTTWTQIYPIPAPTPVVSAITANPVSPAASGSTVTLSATVSESDSSALPAGGSVELFDGVTDKGAATFSATTGAVSKTDTPADGDHTYTFKYTPTSGSGATSPVLAYHVNKNIPTPTVALAVGGGNTTAGSASTLTATVTVGTPPAALGAGTVAFSDNGTALTGTVVNSPSGTYTLSLPTGFTAGSHAVVAKFTPTDPAAFNSASSAAQNFVTAGVQAASCSLPGSVCTDPQNIQATVPAGSLIINTPYTAAHPLDIGTLALQPGATEYTGSGTFSNIIVADTLAGNQPYTISAMSSDLSDGAAHAGSKIDSQNVGLTGLTYTGTGGFNGAVTKVDNPAANPPALPGAALGVAGQQGLGINPHTVASVDHGLGTINLTGTLTINAPTSTEAGLFTGTITFTVG